MVPATRFLVTLVGLLLLDACWFAASRRLRIYPAAVISNAAPAYGLLAWSSIAAGLVVFRGRSWPDAPLRGLVVGLVAYGTFNGTELAIRPDWRRWRTVAPDMVWGCAATTAVAACMHRFFG